MCGILFCNDPAITQDQFDSSLDLITHRGPDASGTISVGNSKLGHRRLKILDLSARGNQPFESRDGRFLMVYNGEIYNYKRLAREKDLQCVTDCDTEVVIELFAQYGPECVKWFDGMFAFVVLNKETGEHFVARDPLGVKPLYTHDTSNGVIISSEIAPILRLLGGSPSFDETGLRQYRKLRACFNNRTIYSGIYSYPAGNYSHKGIRTKYWELPKGRSTPPSDEELRDLISQSVRDRLVSDVPVGSYLSGGLDSSIVAALARKPHTWTIGFEDCNEFEWAQLVAKHIHSTHHETLINQDEFLSLAKEMILKRSEPLSVPNEVLLYKMTKDVKSQNTVIISGEGADELFFGYDRIFRWAAETETFDLREFSKRYSYGTHEDLEIVEDALSPFMDAESPIEIVARFFQVAHLHGLLRRLDNSTMICSVEARVPFADSLPLIERMAGVPYEFRMQNGVVKAPLKRAFADLLPESVIHRKKIGFPAPLDTIPFPNGEATGMDRWLRFNLDTLGVPPFTESPLSLQKTKQL